MKTNHFLSSNSERQVEFVFVHDQTKMNSFLRLDKTWKLVCLVQRPLSVFHFGQSVYGHVVRNDLPVMAWEKAVQEQGNVQVAYVGAVS